jgi:hypothetical protein
MHISNRRAGSSRSACITPTTWSRWTWKVISSRSTTTFSMLSSKDGIARSSWSATSSKYEP